MNSRANERSPCLRPGTSICGELASQNAGTDLSHTSGKSEPVGLGGARRNREIPPDGFLART